MSGMASWKVINRVCFYPRQSDFPIQDKWRLINDALSPHSRSGPLTGERIGGRLMKNDCRQSTRRQ